MTLVAETAIVGGAALGAAAAVMLLARWCGMRARAAWAMSAALGYVAGHAVMMRAIGWSPALARLLRPGESRDWLPLAVLLAAGITIFATYAPRGRGRQLATLAAAIVVIGVPMRLLAGSVFVVSVWSGMEKVGHLALLAGVLGIVWALLGVARDDDVPYVRSGLLAVVALGAARVLVASGVAVYGQLSGVVAASIVGAAAGWLVTEQTGIAAQRWSAARGRPRCPRPLPQHLGRRRGSDPGTRGESGVEGQAALAEPVAHETEPVLHETDPVLHAADRAAQVARPNSGISGAAGVVTLSLGSLVLLGHYFAELSAGSAGLVGIAAIAGSGWLPSGVSRWPKLAAIGRALVCFALLGWAIARCLAAGEADGPASPYGV